MRNRLFCSPRRLLRAIDRGLISRRTWALVAVLTWAFAAARGSSDAPPWMHALTGTSLPSYDEKTDAVLLYSQVDVTVVSAEKIKRHVREAYKILRPEGRNRGTVTAYANSHRKVVNMRGWCIPAQGRDFEVKDKDVEEMSPPSIAGAELVLDLKIRVLHIPASDPGNIVGFEYEVEEQPYVLQDVWDFQQFDPVREGRYSLQLPLGWEYHSSWLNYAEAKPLEESNNQWQWTINDVPGIRKEPHMPPIEGVAGHMVLSFFPPGGAAPQNGFSNWAGMGNWYSYLLSGRLDISPQIQQEVETLTAGKTTALQKIQAIAEFVQHDIRYVAVELGIGGWQPHFAAEVLAHRYGDCKDKATLMRAMLSQIGIQSYHVVLNVNRDAVRPETPAYVGEFNHAILAIQLPEGVDDPSFIAVLQHPKAGRILFFDPTDDMTPLGQIRGPLQANYGLLVIADRSELVQLPKQPTTTCSILRTGKLSLSVTGTLSGEIKEVRIGDRARSERWRLRTVTKDGDRVKPIEDLLADSLTNFRLAKANVVNLQQTDQPFGFNYSVVSDNYAKVAGDLLLVRPRVIGRKSEGFLETKDPRKFPIEFEGPSRDMDVFEIAIPTGYVVDDLPSPVEAEYSFGSYHSRTEVENGMIRYSRTFEVKEVAVPAEHSEELRKFYRTIASDERSTVVLKSQK